VLSSPVFAKPHFRPLILTLLPRAPAPRAGSYDTNYLGSPHQSRAFCGSGAVGDSGPAGEILLQGFTFNFELSTLDLVTFRPSCGFCELFIKTSPPLRPGRAASLESALQNFANSSLLTASQRPPLHQNANFRHLFSTRCALFCNFLHFFAPLSHHRPFVFNHLRNSFALFEGRGEGPRAARKVIPIRASEVCPPRRGDLLFLYFATSLLHYFYLHQNQHSRPNTVFHRVLAAIVRPQPLWNPHFQKARP